MILATIILEIKTSHLALGLDWPICIHPIQKIHHLSPTQNYVASIFYEKLLASTLFILLCCSVCGSMPVTLLVV